MSVPKVGQEPRHKPCADNVINCSGLAIALEITHLIALMGGALSYGDFAILRAC